MLKILILLSRFFSLLFVAMLLACGSDDSDPDPVDDMEVTDDDQGQNDDDGMVDGETLDFQLLTGLFENSVNGNQTSDYSYTYNQSEISKRIEDTPTANSEVVYLFQGSTINGFDYTANQGLVLVEQLRYFYDANNRLDYLIIGDQAPFIFYRFEYLNDRRITEVFFYVSEEAFQNDEYTSRTQFEYNDSSMNFSRETRYLIDGNGAEIVASDLRYEYGEPRTYYFGESAQAIAFPGVLRILNRLSIDIYTDNMVEKIYSLPSNTLATQFEYDFNIAGYVTSIRTFNVDQAGTPTLTNVKELSYN